MNSAFADNVAATGQAAGAVSPTQSTMGMIIWCLVIFGVMYFLMLRPNKKRMEEYKKMLESVQVGSKVVFGGGIRGVVKEINADIVKIEIAAGVVVEVAKSAIAGVMA